MPPYKASRRIIPRLVSLVEFKHSRFGAATGRGFDRACTVAQGELAVVRVDDVRQRARLCVVERVIRMAAHAVLRGGRPVAAAPAAATETGA